MGEVVQFVSSGMYGLTVKVDRNLASIVICEDEINTGVTVEPLVKGIGKVTIISTSDMNRIVNSIGAINGVKIVC
jgi:hypothetical protein